MRKRSAEPEKGQGKKKEMEELREIAEAHYRAGSQQVQDLAKDFFKAMDTDGDERVDLQEFLAFMRQQGYSQMRNSSFFTVLDRDGNGTLDFLEVMTLYYIVKSGRPFCDSCGNFIPGTFFSCVECFKNPETSFNLCLDCYRSIKCQHNHGGRAQFLDNYTLLEAKRDSALAHATGLNSNQVRPTTFNGNVPVPQSIVCMNTAYPTYTNTSYPTYTNASYPNYTYTSYPTYTNISCPTYMNTSYPTYTYATDHPPSPSPNFPNAIVPAAASTMGKWKAALKVFEISLSIGNIATTMCTIL